MWTVSAGSRLCFCICRMSKVGPCSERPQVWRLWAFVCQRRLAEEALRAVSSPWSWSVLFRLMQNLHTNFDKKFCRLQKIFFFQKRWVPCECYMVWSVTDFLGTSLFVHTCHLYGSSVFVVEKSKWVEHFQNHRPQKHDFFLIESSNWMAYIACWCEHFVWCKKTKQMTGFGGKTGLLQSASNRWIEP